VLARIRIQSEQELAEMAEQRRKAAELQYRHAQASALAQQQAAVAGAGRVVPAAGPVSRPAAVEPFVRNARKVGRNEPCPCGSGRKFKQCHGKLA
jgi:preprotein translocase subunit SecA